MEGMFNIFTVYSLICVFLPCLLYQLVSGEEEWETLSGCFSDLDMYISCVCVDGI